MGCTCPSCRDLVSLCWSRLVGGVWVLSMREQLFAPPSVLAAVDPAGVELWFVDKAPPEFTIPGYRNTPPIRNETEFM